MSAIRRSHAEVDMDIALGVLGEFVMGDDQAEEMLSRVQAGVDDGRQQLQGAVEALREIKRVAAIEAPPVSDEVPAKVWKIASDSLNAIRGAVTAAVQGKIRCPHKRAPATCDRPGARQRKANFDARREYLMPYADPAKQREYMRRWVAERRAKYLAGMVCIDCGATEPLEIDHRDPAQKVSHRIWSWRHDRILHELAKCDVRCRDCHQDRHAVERMRHGIGRYKAGCRCDVCRLAKREEGLRYYRSSRTNEEETP